MPYPSARPFQDFLYGLAFGCVDKPACVQHRHVGPVRLSGNGMAGGLDKSHHLFGIHAVFGTAQGNKRNLQASVLLFTRLQCPPRACAGRR